jgi:hypothetical protein
MKAYTNFFETWDVYHIIENHLNGILSKFLQSALQILQPLKLLR